MYLSESPGTVGDWDIGLASSKGSVFCEAVRCVTSNERNFYHQRNLSLFFFFFGLLVPVKMFLTVFVFSSIQKVERTGQWTHICPSSTISILQYYNRLSSPFYFWGAIQSKLHVSVDDTSTCHFSIVN